VSTLLFRSPLSLFSSSKTHLAAGNRDPKCQGLNGHKFSQEETLAGGVPNVRGLQEHRLHRNSRTAKKETDRLAGVATAALPRRGAGMGPAYSAKVRAAVPLRAPAYSASAAHWPLEGQLCRLRTSRL
jgi:hypothetical protein